ncbi:MAG: exodeoxyribonuclease VII large subunit, partial [Rhizobiaceae bacterium]
ILERGFVLVSDAEGRLLKRAAEIAEGAALTLQFADGRVGATANGQAEAPAGEPPRPKPAQKPARPPRGEPGGQGSLF